MKLLDNNSNYPGLADYLSIYSGTTGLDESNARSYSVSTDIRSNLVVLISAYQFETETFIPAPLPWDVSTSADGQITVNFAIPAGYIGNYFITGIKEAKSENLELKDNGVSSFEVTKMHNHDGINSPKVPSSTINISQVSSPGAPANKFLRTDSNGNLIFGDTDTSAPGTFSITAPPNGSNVDISGIGNITFTWGSSSGASSYNISIYDITSGSTNYSGTGVSTGMTRAKSSFTALHSYQVIVTAVNVNGQTSSRAIYFTAAADNT